MARAVPSEVGNGRTAGPPTTLVLRDRWEQMSPTEQTQYLERRAAEGRWEHGRLEGWPANEEWQPMRPLVLDADGYRELGRIAHRILTLTVETCLRRARTAGELGELLGDLRPHLWLDRAAALNDTPLLRIARPDVLLCDGVPQFVELNTAIALYGFPALDHMASAYAGLVPDRWSAPPSTHRARTELLAGIAAGRPGGRLRVLVPTWASRVGPAGRLGTREALRGYLRPTVEAVSALGLDVVEEDLSRLRTDSDGHLLADGGPVDVVFNCFAGARATGADDGVEAVRTALAAGTVQLLLPEAMRMLNNKQALAWLHEDLDLLAPQDRALVEKYVPWTAWTGPRQPPAQRTELLERALADRTDLVLKPAIGANGTGVVFGADVDDRTWHALIGERAAKAAVVLQRRVDSDLVDMPFLAPATGRQCDVRVPVVVGPFIVDGRISGTLVRHFGPENPGAGRIINTRTGATVNTLVLTTP
ncbi:hypothetical protein [Kitasatospora aureofaciens]|uniref:hypothetical protein n=1 Tax=Kitasatospora aureofaciens TaxID=1894 RepID=UPI001C46219B|nr:hypothetical protein [Kitasatospora aureofaciens]